MVLGVPIMKHLRGLPSHCLGYTVLGVLKVNIGILCHF